jgi:hypothetical protein
VFYRFRVQLRSPRKFMAFSDTVVQLSKEAGQFAKHTLKRLVGVGFEPGSFLFILIWNLFKIG